MQAAVLHIKCNTYGFNPALNILVKRTPTRPMASPYLKQIAMANTWNIPDWLETEVRARDKACVYCRQPFTPYKLSKKSAASWEHIINDAKIITRENIALCCCGCNASKGQKQLSVWLESKYCEARGITKESVALIIKQAIADGL